MTPVDRLGISSAKLVKTCGELGVSLSRDKELEGRLTKVVADVISGHEACLFSVMFNLNKLRSVISRDVSVKEDFVEAANKVEKSGKELLNGIFSDPNFNNKIQEAGKHLFEGHESEFFSFLNAAINTHADLKGVYKMTVEDIAKSVMG